MIRLRETPHEKAVMTAFVGIVALLPIVAVFAHRAAAVMVLLMGAIAASRAEPWRKGLPRFLFRADVSNPLVLGAISFLLFCGWAALTARWSPDPGAGRLAANVFFPVLASGVIVWDVLRRAPENTNRLALVFAFGVVASVFLLIFEIVTGGPLRDVMPPQDLSPERFKDMTALGRGLSLVMFAAFPAWLILVRWIEHAEKNIGAAPSRFLRLSAPIVLSLIIAWVALLLGIASNAVAVLVGGVAAFAAGRAPRTTLWTLLIIILGVLAMAPLAAFMPVEQWVEMSGERLPASWAQRLFAWRAAGEATFSCLPFGCGVDYARAIHASGATVQPPSSPIPLPLMPIHPHNVFLQIWMELGAAGAMLFAGVIFGGGLALIRASLPGAVAAGAAGAIAAIFISMMVEASLWQVWRLSAIGLAALGVALSYSFNLREIEWVHHGASARHGRRMR